MNHYRNTTDFLVPLDIDEYIAITHLNEDESVSLSMNKDSILEEFATLPVDGRAYKFINSLSRPLDCDDKNLSQSSFPSICSSKSFYIPQWWKLTSEQDLVLANDWKYYLS